MNLTLNGTTLGGIKNGKGISSGSAFPTDSIGTPPTEQDKTLWYLSFLPVIFSRQSVAMVEAPWSKSNSSRKTHKWCTFSAECSV
jgi:hypothetical protein